MALALLNSTSHDAVLSRSPPAILSRVHPGLPFRPEPGPLPGTDNAPEASSDGWDHDRLTDLIEKFEASASQADDNNQRAERDIDYYDGKQLTGEEKRTLLKRGQPPVIDNRIRRKIDFLQGRERSQRTDPRALPQGPGHEDDAHAATDALRAVCADNKYDQLRSGMWAEMLKAGWGGAEVVLEPKGEGKNPKVTHRKNQWDRMFWDPYSCKVDFSDADYLGEIIWMDRTDAVRKWGPKAEDVYDATIATATVGTMYDDKPKWSVWVDGTKRKRIRVVKMYFRIDDGQWCFAEFTRGGYLSYGPSPWLDDEGEPEHPYVWRSAYIDRENNRYGIIRDMIDTQDSVNKRKSKALHLATVKQTYGTEGSLSSMTTRQLRSELAKPDGHVPLAPGVEWGKQFGVIDTTTNFTEQLELLKEDLNALDLQGPNASQQGKGPQDQSGRAILAQQQGGEAEIGPLLDSLRDADREVYEKTWRRIRQGWTGEEWIRITDDQRNVRFVGLNQYARRPIMDPMTGQPQIDPATGQPATQVVIDPRTQQPVIQKNDVGKLGVDITVADAPKAGQLQGESFQTLAGMTKFVPSLAQEIPTKGWIKLSGIDTAAEVMQMIDDAQQKAAQQPPAPQQQLQVANAEAEIGKKQADATAKKADAVHKIAQAKHLEVIAARDALHTSHDHADHLIDAAHGGLGPDHHIPLAANSPGGEAPLPPMQPEQAPAQ